MRREDVDIVSVCSEPERRARVGALAARAGKHVYLDKPLGCRLEQVDELVEAVRLSGVKSHMFSLLRLPWAARARDIVTNGSIGALTALHCDLLFAKGLAQTPAGIPGHGRNIFLRHDSPLWTLSAKSTPRPFTHWSSSAG